MTQAPTAEHATLVALMESYLAAGPVEKNEMRDREGPRLDAAAAAYDCEKGTADQAEPTAPADLVAVMESYLAAGPVEKNEMHARLGNRLDEAAVAYDRAKGE
jgi:hypothetical protein